MRLCLVWCSDMSGLCRALLRIVCAVSRFGSDKYVSSLSSAVYLILAQIISKLGPDLLPFDWLLSSSRCSRWLCSKPFSYLALDVNVHVQQLHCTASEPTPSTTILHS